MNMVSEIKVSYSQQRIPQISGLIEQWIDRISFSDSPIIIVYDGYNRYEPSDLDKFFKGYNSLYFFKKIIFKVIRVEKIENSKNLSHLRTIDYLIEHKTDAIESTNIETIKDLLNKLDILYREEL